MDVEVGKLQELLSVRYLDRSGFSRKDAERSKAVNGAIEVHDREAGSLSQVGLTEWNNWVVDAKRFTPSELLAQQMCNALTRGPPADVE